MTTLEDIRAWAASGESEVLEFKATTGERRDGTRSLSGMLNHQGGRVLFGISPDHNVVGQQVTDRTIEDIALEIKEIEPPVFPTIERLPVGNGREVIIASVQSGQNKPYSYRGHSYRRVGNTTPQMSREEYNRMLLERLHGETRWENE